MPNKVEAFPCKECGKPTVIIGERNDDYYMVKNKVWYQASKCQDGFLHLDCLEKRLGRKLTADDFDMKIPVNYFNNKVRKICRWRLLMSNLYESIRTYTINEMKNKGLLVSFLRYIDSNIQNRAMADRKPIDDDMVISILKTEKKKIAEELENCRKLNKVETISILENQDNLINKFLPSVLDEESTRKEIEAIISNLGATTVKDMGKVMGAVKSKLGSSVDMGIASKIVKSILV